MVYKNQKIYIIMRTQKIINKVLEAITWGLIVFCVAGIVQLLINIL